MATAPISLLTDHVSVEFVSEIEQYCARSSSSSIYSIEGGALRERYREIQSNDAVYNLRPSSTGVTSCGRCAIRESPSGR